MSSIRESVCVCACDVDAVSKGGTSLRLLWQCACVCVCQQHLRGQKQVVLSVPSMSQCEFHTSVCVWVSEHVVWVQLVEGEHACAFFGLSASICTVKQKHRIVPAST